MKTSEAVRLYLHHSLPVHWRMVIGQLPALAALPTWKGPAILIGEQTEWAPDHPDHSLCTDRAILPSI
jgi:hypothetical protein